MNALWLTLLAGIGAGLVGLLGGVFVMARQRAHAWEERRYEERRETYRDTIGFLNRCMDDVAERWKNPDGDFAGSDARLAEEYARAQAEVALSASQELTQCFDLCTGLYRMYLVETSKWHALRTQAVPASPRKLRRARRSCGYGHDYLLGMMQATESFARQELDEYPSRITQRLLASSRRVFRPFRVWRILRRARRQFDTKRVDTRGSERISAIRPSASRHLSG